MLASPGHLRRCLRRGLVGLLLVLSACGDDAEPSSEGAETAPTESGASDPSGSDDPSDPSLDTSAGEVGPTARVRIVNIVRDVELVVWVADVDFNPMPIGEPIAYGTVSPYLDVPLDMLGNEPQLVVVPAGEVVENVSTWQIDNSTGPDRAFVTVGELDGPDEQASVILSLDDNTGNVQYEQLDETELELGDAAMANLHVSSNLFDLGGGVVASFAVVGEPCLFDGSTSVTQVFPVASGTFEVGIYDRQMVSECTMLLASTEITATAGEQVLVVTYHEDDVVKLLSAAIPQ